MPVDAINGFFREEFRGVLADIAARRLEIVPQVECNEIIRYSLRGGGGGEYMATEKLSEKTSRKNIKKTYSGRGVVEIVSHSGVIAEKRVESTSS